MLKTLVTLLLFTSISVTAQQAPDTLFSFEINSPKYTEGAGSKICIDSSQNNFHTKEGRFAPFSKLLKRDGYQLEDIPNYSKLESCSILVISNPIHEKNLGNWIRPIYSSFNEDEIEDIQNWIMVGGSLFLIADHMPFAGAANDLAKAFGFEFSDGFARIIKDPNLPDVFSKENGRLNDHSITLNISAITSFTGSAFTYPKEATPILKFKKGDFSLEPDTAWRFNENTPRIELEDYAQGALLQYGEGKVAVFGEAAMFTAQTVTNQQGEFKVGFNSQFAPNNVQFLLNLVHWLDE